MTKKNQQEGGTATAVRSRPKVKKPKMFKVILLNDDYTSMEFVIAILEQVFSRSPAEAVDIMLRVHKAGRGLAGLYPKEIAEAKIVTVHTRARQQGFPLRCTMEDE